MAELSVLDGLFKEVYADEIENLVPESSHITKAVSFKKATQQGRKFVQPVIVSSVGGFTVGSNSQAYTLNASAGMVTADAEISSPGLVLRQAIPYGQLAQSTSDKGAFINATRLTVEVMIEAITKRNEINFLYGDSGIGSTSANDTYVSGSDITISIDAGSWAAGIWSGSESSTTVQLYDTTAAANVNDGAGNDTFVVKSVDIDNKKVTLTAANATLAAAVNTAITTNSHTCVIYYVGTKGVESLGLQAICEKSGTLFNIDNSVYSLFKGNDVSIATPLTISKLLAAFSSAIGRGLSEETTIYLNPKTWLTLATDLQSIRKIDASYKPSKLEDGTEALELYTSAGVSKIVPHLFVKEADVFILPLKRLVRTGASDVTFTLDGMEGKFFRQLENQAGFELRCFSSQSIFTAHPAKCTYAKIS